MGSHGVSLHWPSMTKAQILRYPGQAIVELFRGWHKARGWQDIGYHFVINRDAVGTPQMFEGRNIWTPGAHSGTNYGNQFIGINIAYGTDEAIPENMFDCLAKNIAALSDKYDFQINEQTVRGHYTFVPTDCPGQSLIKRLPELRQRAKAYAQRTLKPAPPTPPLEENIGKIKVNLLGENIEGLRLNSQGYLHIPLLEKLGFDVRYDSKTDTIFIKKQGELS